jgi:hypothetical protein
MLTYRTLRILVEKSLLESARVLNVTCIADCLQELITLFSRAMTESDFS